MKFNDFFAKFEDLFPCSLVIKFSTYNYYVSNIIVFLFLFAYTHPAIR